MSTSSSNHPKEPRGTAQPGDWLRTNCMSLWLHAQIPQDTKLTHLVSFSEVEANSASIWDTRIPFNSFIQHIFMCPSLPSTKNMEGDHPPELPPLGLVKESNTNHQGRCPARRRQTQARPLGPPSALLWAVPQPTPWFCGLFLSWIYTYRKVTKVIQRIHCLPHIQLHLAWPYNTY